MDKRFAGLIAILFLAASLFIGFTLFNLYGDELENAPVAGQLIRATADKKPSTTNSLMFVFPLKASANDTSIVKVDVFVRNDSGKVLSNQKVTLNSDLGEVKAISPITNSEGKASFEVSSSTTGKATLTALVNDSAKLQQEVVVVFE